MTKVLKNILYLSSFGDLGRGGQESLFHLVTNLNRKRYEPFVVLPVRGSLMTKLETAGIKTRVVAFPKIFNFKIHSNVAAVYNLMRRCVDNRVDLIHSDGPRNTFYGGIVGRLRHIPLVWHIRASNRDRYDRLLYRMSSKIILVAQALRTRFSWTNNNAKFVTIHNGIDLSALRIGTEGPTIRQQFNIDKEELLIAVTARVEQLKGQKFLIEACGKLKNRIPQQIRLLLAGEIMDPGYQRECESMAIAYGIKDSIIFGGHLGNIGQLLTEADIFVLPSLFEAFPRAVIEAMGAGKPVVATDVGGCTEAVENEVSGFIVPPANVPALVDVLLKLGKDKQLRVNVGKAARSRAEKKFNIEENVRQTEKVYHELLAGGQDVIV